jgi:hypothetical protein
MSFFFMYGMFFCVHIRRYVDFFKGMHLFWFKGFYLPVIFAVALWSRHFIYLCLAEEE